jgi:uncharacterized membrane protein YeaQ/YmgE (transglycosylase-associated protein family)
MDALLVIVVLVGVLFGLAYEIEKALRTNPRRFFRNCLIGIVGLVLYGLLLVYVGLKSSGQWP